jgi:hypothetical protein
MKKKPKILSTRVLDSDIMRVKVRLYVTTTFTDGDVSVCHHRENVEYEVDYFAVGGDEFYFRDFNFIQKFFVDTDTDMVSLSYILQSQPYVVDDVIKEGMYALHPSLRDLGIEVIYNNKTSIRVGNRTYHTPSNIVMFITDQCFRLYKTIDLFEAEKKKRPVHETGLLVKKK